MQKNESEIAKPVPENKKAIEPGTLNAKIKKTSNGVPE
jgi:hypothetical protein